MATLHIIGNGFDLYHGLETTYEHFQEYAWENATFANAYYLEMLEIVYPRVNSKTGLMELWSNLEYALGCPNVEAAFNMATEVIDFEEGYESMFLNQMQGAPDSVIPAMFDAFHRMLEKWVNSIRISKNENIPAPAHFDANGRFLSFNYTDTLEIQYNIPRERINYIHGRRNSNEKLVIGHCNIVVGSKHLSDWPLVYEYQAYDSIARIVNGERKKVAEIIEKNRRYWKTLADTDKVVVYGHSLAEVDRAYFGEIAKHIQPDAQWYFSIHHRSQEEYEKNMGRVQAMVDYLNLDHSQWQTFEMGVNKGGKNT